MYDVDGGWAALARAVRERMDVMSLSRQKVYSLGGPAIGTMSKVLAGEPVSKRTLLLLDKALQWDMGTSHMILQGVPRELPPPIRETFLPSGVTQLSSYADPDRQLIDVRQARTTASTLRAVATSVARTEEELAGWHRLMDDAADAARQTAEPSLVAMYDWWTAIRLSGAPGSAFREHALRLLGWYANSQQSGPRKTAPIGE